MSQYPTKQNVQNIVNTAMHGAVTEISQIFSDALTHIDDRFNRLETRVDRIEDKLDSMQLVLTNTLERVDTHDVRLRRLETTAGN